MPCYVSTGNLHNSEVLEASSVAGTPRVSLSGIRVVSYSRRGVQHPDNYGVRAFARN